MISSTGPDNNSTLSRVCSSKRSFAAAPVEAMGKGGFVRMNPPEHRKRQRTHTVDGFWLSSRCQVQRFNRKMLS